MVARRVVQAVPYSLPGEARARLHVSIGNCLYRFRKLLTTHILARTSLSFARWTCQARTKRMLSA